MARLEKLAIILYYFATYLSGLDSNILEKTNQELPMLGMYLNYFSFENSVQRGERGMNLIKSFKEFREPGNVYSFAQ